MPLKSEYELSNPPNDGITRVSFAPINQSPLLLVSSWDTGVRLYDVSTPEGNMRSMYSHQYPVFDCCLIDNTRSFSAGLDRCLKTYDFQVSREDVLGYHDDAIRCVEYCPQLGIVVTGSWDRTVKLWDPRQKVSIGTYDQSSELVYSMSLSGERLVVGTSNRRVLVWDLRNMQFAEQRRASSLKYQTRCLRCFPNRQGFVLSSIEGRVAVEYLDTSDEMQQKKYAFKCHRLKEEGTEMIYPVNAVSFHNVHNTFATGGSDGFVNIWDPFNKKRLCQFHRYPADISSLAFNHDGSIIAIAISKQLVEEGSVFEKGTIILRHVSDNETRPK